MINALIQTSYPQALAKLIATLKSIDQAEDFLQSAVEQALIKWPNSQPENTVAWLVRVAQNKYIDHYRRQQKHQPIESMPELTVLPDLSEQALLSSYNDDLLRLIFTCCHPALNQETQIALALKHVLGLNVLQIANALVISKTTLEQRLIRAKKKIEVNQIRYEIPPSRQWSERLNGVLKTVYLLFNEGYLTTKDDQLVRQSLCNEAIRLSRLLHQCIKNNPDVIGLLALLLQQDARLPARADSKGQLILLADQNRFLWKNNNIQEGNILVDKALRVGRRSSYAIQAAIASLHNNSASESETDWSQIYGLYQLLILLDNNPVIKLNAAIALAKTGKTREAINWVCKLRTQLEKYRHYYTSLAGLYYESEQFKLALKNYQTALKKTNSKRETDFIKMRIENCQRISN